MSIMRRISSTFKYSILETQTLVSSVGCRAPWIRTCVRSATPTCFDFPILLPKGPFTLSVNDAVSVSDAKMMGTEYYQQYRSHWPKQ